MDERTSMETILTGWYWHHQSQRPVYVYQDASGWHAHFIAAAPEHRGSDEDDHLLNDTRVALRDELYLELVPLFRRPTVDIDRRRNPHYPLVLPCQKCGLMTPSSFIPTGDGTWVARPLCDVHTEQYT